MSGLRDEELAEIKRQHKHTSTSYEQNECKSCALLRRLEAAERVIVESRRSWVKTEHRMKAYIESVEGLIAYEAWLRSKGGAGK